MRIELRRNGRVVSMKCSGEFKSISPQKTGGVYGASNTTLPLMYTGDIIWFGLGWGGICERYFYTIQEAIESFEKTKAAALDYRRRIHFLENGKGND